MARSIRTERRESSQARVPSVPAGTAVVYTRYDEEKTVVMNPADFHRLAELEDEIRELAGSGGSLTDLVVRAHQLEESPSEPVEDPEAIKALLGL